MNKRWTLASPDTELQSRLSRSLSILPVTAQLLINRGIISDDAAAAFLRPELSSIHDPFLMKDMERAVERIARAVAAGEKIAIYGDYDTDGVTATALLAILFRELKADAVSCIPERKTEGYGLNIEAIKRLDREGVKLLITVDCGSTNHEEVSFANSLGMDVVVTDHHEPKGRPPALAFLNPRAGDCAFPFKWLSGAGVALNLAIALRKRLRDSMTTPNLKRYLDIVALGTIADMAPLTGENRILASYGLKELESTARPGLRALKEAAGVRKMTSDSVAFQLAPRLNAAGRIGSPRTALALLLAEDPDEAALLARKLNSDNAERQAIEENVIKEALALGGAEDASAIILSKEGWHPGVVGIAAGKLAERFSRPVVLVGFEGDIGRGSARGVKGFNVLDGLEYACAHLERYGGHKLAAGLTVRKEKFGDFKGAYLEYMERCASDAFTPEVFLDCAVLFDDITERLLCEVELFEPFGQRNFRPLFLSSGVSLVNAEPVKGKHLRMTLCQNGRTQRAIAFGMSAAPDGTLDVAFYPYVESWQGEKTVMLNIKEFRSPER
jgi:single-stranded-DNA-specific exonuclease